MIFPSSRWTWALPLKLGQNICRLTNQHGGQMVYPPNGNFNEKIMTNPVDLGVPYFQTDPPSWWPTAQKMSPSPEDGVWFPSELLCKQSWISCLTILTSELYYSYLTSIEPVFIWVTWQPSRWSLVYPWCLLSQDINDQRRESLRSFRSSSMLHVWYIYLHLGDV